MLNNSEVSEKKINKAIFTIDAELKIKKNQNTKKKGRSVFNSKVMSVK